MLHLVHAPFDLVHVVAVVGEGALRDDPPAVERGVDPVDRHPVDLHPVGAGLLDRVRPQILRAHV